MRSNTAITIALVSITLVGCSQKEETPNAASTATVVCTYAPSQSNKVLALSTTAGGTGAAAAIVANAAGLTAVAHSSGAIIFTGASGYVAGTIGLAAVVPIAVTVGALAGGAAATIELACAPKNHPKLVAQVQAMANTLVADLKK